MELQTDTNSTITLIQQILNYNTHLLNTGTTTSFVFFPAMNKNLYVTPVKICTSRGDPLPRCVHIHYLDSINIQQASMNISRYHFFLMEGTQFHTFASYALPCQMPPCQIALQLPSVTQQQVMDYCREGSTLPMFFFGSVRPGSMINGTGGTNGLLPQEAGKDLHLQKMK